MNPAIETVVLIRHARSTANLDPGVYLRTADHAIPLYAPDDDPAALAAGAHVRALALEPRRTCLWSSTFLRCRQTQALVMRAALGAAAAGLVGRESFLLREQEFGDWDGFSEEEMEAHDPWRFAKRKRMTDADGRFYFRYPNGESRADVVQRMAIFMGKLHRSRFAHHVVFLHGVTQRAFRMAWFNRPVAWFETEPNPANASVLAITRDDAGHWTERYLDDSVAP